ncbi:Protein FRA10AC1 like protein [Eufriesea mexicana]|uniref:Protein FRA10AC1 like protein n=1 Tax=Eufriesea mexicana TaxID=516756 RepID=A0A310SS06_9HYME|nr:PREDICTED: protein FRA10AC1 [Eufriesea mexicana]OAD59882.1 Protein FRA10AC1 like protein [Eufriesea mexicana]
MFPAYAYLSAYDRHKKLINDYFTLYGGSISSLKRDTSRDKTDYDVIRENHRFLWDQDNDEPNTWGARLAKKYYDKLFKEYCIADLTYYKQNKVALRWRTEKEVIIGKGQFECGNKKCKEKEQLKSWEVNFGYIEHGQKKNALIKLRLCPECSIKLNYRSQKREAKKHKTLKRLGTNSETLSSKASTSTVHIKTEENEVMSNTEESVEETKKDESKIWKEKPIENLEKTREEEFEEYLADLLM